MATVKNLIDKELEKKILASEYASNESTAIVKTSKDSFYLSDYIERDIIAITRKLYGVTSDSFVLDILDKISYYTTREKKRMTKSETLAMLSSHSFISYFNRLYAMAILKFNDATPNGVRHIQAYMRHIHSNTSMSNNQILTLLEEPQVQTVQKYFESLSIDELIIEASIEPNYTKVWHSVKGEKIEDSINELITRINRLTKTQKLSLWRVVMYYSSNKNTLPESMRHSTSRIIQAMQLKHLTYKQLLEVIARNFQLVANGIKFY